MATSGTVLAYPYDSTKVIEHSFRRAGMLPAMASSENVAIAQDCLFTILAQMVSAKAPLWTRYYTLLGPVIGSPVVATPVGTLDVDRVFWRALNPYRGPATATDATNVAALFGGQPNADITIAGPNPGVAVNFGSATEIDTIGVLPGAGAAYTAALNVQVSTDGVTYTTAQALPSATYRAGQWSYVDLKPTVSAQYVRLQYPVSGSWTLNQLNFGLSNYSETELGALNEDDYYQLPNKQFSGDRPNSRYLDRQIDQVNVLVWPVPNVSAFYNGLVTAYLNRYIQDPGQMSNTLELRATALEAVQWSLALTLLHELPDQDSDKGQPSYFSLMAKQNKLQAVQQMAQRALAIYESEERVIAPIRIAPAIGGYTR